MPSPSRTSSPSRTKLKNPTSSASSSTTARSVSRLAGCAKSSTRRGSFDVSYHSYGNSYCQPEIADAWSSVSGTTFTASSLRWRRSALRTPARAARQRSEVEPRVRRDDRNAARAALDDAGRRGEVCAAEHLPLRFRCEEHIGRKRVEQLTEAHGPECAHLRPRGDVDRHG